MLAENLTIEDNALYLSLSHTLGGDTGSVLKDYFIPLSEKVMSYNGFDYDISYLRLCSHQKEASGIGVAKHFFRKI